MPDINALKLAKIKRDEHQYFIADRKLSAKVDLEQKKFEIIFESHKICQK